METLTEALDRLDVARFGDDLVPEGRQVRAVGTGVVYDPVELVVAEVIRFEGATDPGDEAIRFALTNAVGEPVGTFTTPYGPSAGPEEAEIVEQLHRPPLDPADIAAHRDHDHLVAVFANRTAAQASVDELRHLGLGSEHLGVAVHGPGQVAFEHDSDADVSRGAGLGVGAGAVAGFLAGFALFAGLAPVAGVVGVGGLLAIGAASGFAGAMVGGYLGVATEEHALTVHEYIARTQLQPGEILVAVCSHGHPDEIRDVFQRHGGGLRDAPSA